MAPPAFLGADSGKKAPPSDEDLRDMLKRVQEQAAAQSAFKCIQQVTATGGRHEHA